MSTYDDGYNDGLTACTVTIAYYTDVRAKPWIYGNIFAGALYGAIVLIAIAYLRILVIHIKGKKLLSTQQRILSIYVAVAIVLSTIQIGAALQATTKGLHKLGCTESESDVSLFSGGKGWLEVVCFMLTAWTVDMIMMWRFFVIYYDLRRTKWSIFVFSSLIQTASIGIGIFTAFIMHGYMGLDNSETTTSEPVNIFNETISIATISLTPI
ncbi:hypothetical protein BDQ17DRAFT_1436323 [Cyathus striatus]|nr:hypothetical protein BDQ17DRAFT_1436323 [Cyathus striatus]